MTTVAEVSSWMEQVAPNHLAESWDNVGLLWGDPSAEVTRLMTCLTVTPESAAEAIDEHVEMIVSHHPILFRPIQQLRADCAGTGHLWSLAKAGVAIHSPHTALDNADGGINDGLAKRLGLIEVKALRAAPAEVSFKVVVFVPSNDRDAVLSAAFSAGAGHIGAYDECSFSTGGYGTFLGTEGANPTVGKVGTRERVREWKLEVVCPVDRLVSVLAAVRAAHSYEEPAIDVIPLHAVQARSGIGRLGRLPKPMTLGEFATHVATSLACSLPQFVGEESRKIATVAIACGAGDDFLKDAHRASVDVLLTGEARFHRALEAEALGVALVLAGHYATERPGVEDLARRIARSFPNLEVWPSRREHDPLS